MAENREVKAWITVNGRHIPVFEGQTKEEAAKKVIKGSKVTGKESDKKNAAPDTVKNSAPKKSDSKKESAKSDKKNSATRRKEWQDKLYNSKKGDTLKINNGYSITKDDDAPGGTWTDNKGHKALGDDLVKELAHDKHPIEKVEKVKKQTKVQKQIDKDTDTKEKQIANNKKQADTVAGKSESVNKHPDYNNKNVKEYDSSNVPKKIGKDEEYVLVRYDKKTGKFVEYEGRGTYGAFKANQVATPQGYDSYGFKSYQAAMKNFNERNGNLDDYKIAVVKREKEDGDSLTEQIKNKSERTNKSRVSDSHMSRDDKKPTQKSTAKNIEKANLSPKEVKGAELARKNLVFNGDKAQITQNHWRGYNISDNRMLQALNATDPNYSYEIKSEETRETMWGVPNQKVTRYYIVRKKK